VRESPINKVLSNHSSVIGTKIGVIINSSTVSFGISVASVAKVGRVISSIVGSVDSTYT
jgi:hypothetical protein